MKLSIITINYNNCDGLRKTIESVVNQTCHEFEYIIIDGGSTDGSVDVIKQYADKIDYWVSEPDKGIYNAMNKGISAAKGEYLNFMNSGDCFFDNTSVSNFNDINANEDIVFGNMIDSITGKRMGCIATDKITAADFFTASLPHQASFIRKQMFEKYGLYDEKYKIASDWKFFLYVIVFMNVSLRYIDINFATFENLGISTSDHTTERDAIITELFPPKIIADYTYALSLRDVYKSSLCRFLYSILYRIYRLIHKLN